MRKIKFRAWDNDFNKMFNVVEISYEDKTTLAWREPYNGERVNWSKSGLEVGAECDLMQYTGLNDKNDKEIYEGDIVQFTVNKFGGNGVEKTIKNGLVYFNHEGILSVDGWILARVKSREIIGNKYENPELLNAQYENVVHQENL